MSETSIEPLGLSTPPLLSAWNLEPEDTVAKYLNDQQQLTPVERFSRYHDAGTLPLQARYYQELIPEKHPGQGQQYGFEVDIDRCTGCKACVTACHNLNGLLDQETWRHVGMVREPATGGEFKFVTSSCHHCALPECAVGCPADAYEKLPTNGVVKHLDDQCIGCQYCTWTCPYEAPQYQPDLGIVRKCDLCVSRLDEGEAPACVQACPNQAIRVVLVETEEALSHPENFVALPDAPDSGYTRPTTRYRSKSSLPDTMSSGDRGVVHPEPYHWPVLAMLLITQSAFGGYLAYSLLGMASGRYPFGPTPWGGFSLLAWMQPDRWFLLLGMAGIHLSLLHLGRPHLAFRAVLGWRHSWLSREVLAFAAWMTVAGPCLFLERIPFLLQLTLHFLGALCIYCSAQVYRKTPRELWRSRETYMRFFGHALTTGTLLGALVFTTAGRGTLPLSIWVYFLAFVIIMMNLLRLAANLRVLTWHKKKQWDGLKKSARIQIEYCLTLLQLRVLTLFLGGVIIPALLPLLAGIDFATPAYANSLEAMPPIFIAALGMAVLLSLIAEFSEKAMFFRSGCGPKMPGNPSGSSAHAH